MRVLLVDDEPFYYKLIAKPIKKAGYDLAYARSGREGLSLITTYQPDVVIMDIRLPDYSGYDITERLRRDPKLREIPVIFVSGQQDLDDKLKAFELGADDYLVKPFQPEELVARLKILARRSEAMKVVQSLETNYVDTSSVVVVHSLRGGTGCSSLAVNLALAFNELWLHPTVVVDLALVAGQVAMMLDGTPQFTWQDFSKLSTSAIDKEMVEQMITRDKTGIKYIAAPKFPFDGEMLDTGFIKHVLEQLRQMNEFIVIDTAHDFTENTLQALDTANYILLIMTPDMASLRAAVSALNVYRKLGYEEDKVLVTLNQTTSHMGIKQSQIEKVLGQQIDLVVPYGSSEIVRAINFGEPFILKNPDSPVSIVLENTAYQLSQELLKNIPPASPTPTWKRVTDRLSGKKNK